MKKSDLFFAFIQLPVDIIMTISAFALAYYLRINLEVVPALSDIGIREYLRYCFYLMPIWIALFSLNGLYRIKAANSFFAETYKIFSASSTAMLFLVVGIFLAHSLFFSRLILIFTWVLSILAICFGRIVIKLIQRYLFRFGIGRQNLVLIGDNNTSENVIYHLSKSKNSAYKVLGVLDAERTESKYNLKILGSVSDLEKIILKQKIDEIILTDINLSKSKLMYVIQICSDRNITFKYIPDTFSLMSLNVSPNLVGSMPVMELKSIPLDGWGRIVKRIIDFSFSLIFLLILSPIFLIIAILEKMTSRGPVLYCQDRIGRDEKIIKCHKFRSMYYEGPKSQKQAWTTQNDPRITPLGNILRKTNLDELPQLWDILSGNMSFVGPRPEQPKFVEKFEKEIPEYFRRHRVKAGLTGWAQVNGLKGDTSIKERVRYDAYYIENWSLWFDFKIIIKTIGITIYETFAGKYEYRSNS